MSGGESALALEMVEDCFGDVSFLWTQWDAARASSKFTVVDLRRLEERIESRAQALLNYGGATFEFARAQLHAKRASDRFVAAWLLLRLEKAGATDAIVAAWRVAKLELRPSLMRAFAHAAQAEDIQRLVASLDPKNVAALLSVGSICGIHRHLIKTISPEIYLRDADPTIREAAWKTILYQEKKPSPELALAGALDENPRVRQLALEAATWSGQSWVLDHCRRAAEKPTMENFNELRILAILGGLREAPMMLSLAKKTELGPGRFDLLGSYGQSEIIPCLLEAMTEADPKSAAAAGAAFTRITGEPMKTAARVTLAPADGSIPDDFESHFLEEVYLPDPRHAAAHWSAKKNNYHSGQRYSQGCPVPEVAPFSAELDVLSIKEACLRAAFSGKRSPGFVDLERFPMRLTQ